MIPSGLLQLPQVTLVAVDTRAPDLAVHALVRSMAGVRFARVVLFSGAEAAAVVPDAVELDPIAPIVSGAGYSRFVLRELPARVHTSHVLIVQWDGFVVDASAWRDEFLDWDYVGAVWTEAPRAGAVGNGGFSLRSRRMLEAGRDPRIEQEHPEDLMLCHDYRALLERDHGVRIAPPQVARRFAFENERPAGPTFGFHGPYHLPRFLDEATMERWLGRLPDAFFRSRDARRLARALLARRMARAARLLVERRRASGMHDPKTRLLGLAAAALAAVEPAQGRQ
jgi:hypothetical protein